MQRLKSLNRKAIFIHKIKIVLKELRESSVCLKLISKSSIHDGRNDLSTIINEFSELTEIFVASIRTAKLKKRIPE